MSDDRRAVLEAIAYGSDSAIRPGERLRAIELLDPMGTGDRCAFCERVQDLDGTELQADMDATTAALLLSADDKLLQMWPETVRVLAMRVDKRVRERLRAMEEASPPAPVFAIVSTTNGEYSRTRVT